MRGSVSEQFMWIVDDPVFAGHGIPWSDALEGHHVRKRTAIQPFAAEDL